ncbi:MAG: alpha-hydroxy-acid oxidizing protein [Cyclobacteriaceae bacterium]|nr:alpha-hydroxy-acid oxidizing protein [Cyclobacteriaceae bacterium]
MKPDDFSPANHQRDIYLRGFAGHLPRVPIEWRALEDKAKDSMTPEAWAYIAGGAGLESTVAANRQDFESLKIVPRMLRDTSQRDTSTSLLGRTLASPLLLAPVGVLEMVHPEADLAVARAAASLGVPYIFSNQASRPMEEVAAVMGDSPRWFQLYWSKSNDLVASFVQRAERVGCQAIVVTLDTTHLGWRTRDLSIAYLPFLEGKGIAQYTSDPVFQRLMDEPSPPMARPRVTASLLSGLIKMVNAYPGSGFLKKLKSGRPQKAVQKFTSIYSNPALTWKDLAFLRQQTRLPILLKGILHPDDAALALDHGIDGIVVSNHGGRQVDGSISTIAALPAIAAKVNGKVPVLLDGGVRGGADMFKALALGATAVCIGRPYVYGLAVGGADGVGEVLRNLMAEFYFTMGLAGINRVDEITRDTLAR